jgi:hypothetical protein
MLPMWFWDGSEWRYGAAPTQQRPGMLWFFEAPSWFAEVVLTGLIGLIPVVGGMVALGWYLAARDNLRRGYWIVPRAGFAHIERGAGPYLVLFLYSLGQLVVFAAAALGFSLALVAQAPGIVFVLLIAAAFLVWCATLILIGFLSGAAIGVADAAGIVAALDPVLTWRVAVANAGRSWRVFGAFVLGGLIAFVANLLIPFGGAVIVPAAYLMASPAQAELDERVAG